MVKIGVKGAEWKLNTYILIGDLQVAQGATINARRELEMQRASGAGGAKAPQGPSQRYQWG
jgi:hypothetical protein